MRLNKTTNHAIRILVDCAQSGDELVKVAQISQRLDITPQNTFKIVHLLSRGGFITAVRGRHGGVKLARRPEDIRVGEVVGVIETSSLEARGEDDRQSAQAIFDDALEAFISVLNQHTIADMAGAQAPVASEEEHKSAPSKASARPRASSSRASKSSAPAAGRT
jgi:Rrf2 family protein